MAYAAVTTPPSPSSSGKPRFFVADENADWISDPFDTREEAVAEISRRLQPTCPYCDQPVTYGEAA